jgi:hypothetical protein
VYHVGFTVLIYTYYDARSTKHKHGYLKTSPSFLLLLIFFQLILLLFPKLIFFLRNESGL